VERAVALLLISEEERLIFGDREQFILVLDESVEKEALEKEHAPMGSEEVDGVLYQIYGIQE
jgi:hypothetical protein